MSPQMPLHNLQIETIHLDNIHGTTVILDIDGTITADGQVECSSGVLATLRDLAARNNVYLGSNHQNRARNRAIARRIGCFCIETPHLKPNSKVFEAIPACHRTQPIVVIGDKYLVDGLFARRIGALFIKVGRITSTDDRTFVKVAYFLDDLVSTIAGWLDRPR